MPFTYISRMVNLEPSDYRTVRQFAKDKGLGGKGFSAALRIIIREWASLKKPHACSVSEGATSPSTASQSASPNS